MKNKKERLIKVYGNSVKKRNVGGKFMPPIYKCELDLNKIETYNDYPNIKNDKKLADHISQLKKSIKKNGIIEPLFVWNMWAAQHDQDVGYKVVIGNSRYYVAKKLKIKKVTCLVVNNRGNGTFGEEHTIGERLETEEEIKACFKNKDIRFIYKDGVIFTMNMSFIEDSKVKKNIKKK